jgi:uncharacterized protein with NAD-binding domain and iron-sulfur cluster
MLNQNARDEMQASLEHSEQVDRMMEELDEVGFLEWLAEHPAPGSEPWEDESMSDDDEDDLFEFDDEADDY